MRRPRGSLGGPWGHRVVLGWSRGDHEGLLGSPGRPGAAKEVARRGPGVSWAGPGVPGVQILMLILLL